MRISDWSSDVCSSDLLITRIERRGRQRAHGGKIALQPFLDRLALAAQPVALALAALLLQPDVEGLPCRKLRDRHHEVAPGIANKPLDTALVIAFPRTAVTIPDQVVGQEAAEKPSKLDRKSTSLHSSH